MPDAVPLDYKIFKVELTIAVPDYFCNDHQTQIDPLMWVSLDDEATLLGSKETLLQVTE